MDFSVIWGSQFSSLLNEEEKLNQDKKEGSNISLISAARHIGLRGKKDEFMEISKCRVETFHLYCLLGELPYCCSLV